MTIRYEENRIYTAECNICGGLYTVEKSSLTEMELFMKTNGWEIWKSDNAHQPNSVCYHCKSIERIKAMTEEFRQAVREGDETGVY